MGSPEPQPNLKNQASRRDQIEKLIEPTLLEQMTASVLVPILGMWFVEITDLPRFGTHPIIIFRKYSCSPSLPLA
jgi:hypothetical protein